MKIFKENREYAQCDECKETLYEGYVIEIGNETVTICRECYENLVKEIKVQEYRESLE